MARILRTAPKPPFWDADPGICRGCGEEFTTKAGERHRGRRWCADCAPAWRVASQPLVARAAVFQRDVGICHDCGLDCTSYEVDSGAAWGTYRVQINRQRALVWCERALDVVNHSQQRSRYLIDLGDWHVDHAMPLHLVDREKPEAWREWTLPNLRTRCPSCHAEKTAEEARMRGKVRRLNGTTKKKPGRNIAQRANPWPKGRSMQSKLPGRCEAGNHEWYLRSNGSIFCRRCGKEDDKSPAKPNKLRSRGFGK